MGDVRSTEQLIEQVIRESHKFFNVPRKRISFSSLVQISLVCRYNFAGSLPSSSGFTFFFFGRGNCGCNNISESRMRWNIKLKIKSLAWFHIELALSFLVFVIEHSTSNAYMVSLFYWIQSTARNL